MWYFLWQVENDLVLRDNREWAGNKVCMPLCTKIHSQKSYAFQNIAQQEIIILDRTRRLQTCVCILMHQVTSQETHTGFPKQTGVCKEKLLTKHCTLNHTRQKVKDPQAFFLLLFCQARFLLTRGSFGTGFLTYYGTIYITMYQCDKFLSTMLGSVTGLFNPFPTFPN